MSCLQTIEATRQVSKVKYSIGEIILLVLIGQLDLKDTIITIDAMGTQKEIAETILKNKADYCLAVKKNHQYLYEDIKDYLCDEQFQEQLKQANRYFRTIEKVRDQVEIREYFIFPSHQKSAKLYEKKR
jgi:predicted transposase YbfD/YdcC